MRDPNSLLTGVRVLVVDDDPDETEMLSVVLGLYGADVGVAASYGEAIRLVAEWRPDVLLTDIALPDGDGCDLLRAVRRVDPHGRPHVPAIALTGWTRECDRDAASDAGFELYFAKPVALDRLVGALARLARREASTATQ
jgi:hypothetical protein